MFRLKTLALAAVAAIGVSTFTGSASAQYYPQGYYQQYGVQPRVQPRLTRKQIAKLRAREQARRERLAREQFLARRRAAVQQQYIYEDEPVPYVVQRQYVPQYQPQYVPQYQPQYVPPQPRYRPQVVQPQYAPPQPRYRPHVVQPGYDPNVIANQYRRGRTVEPLGTQGRDSN